MQAAAERSNRADHHCHGVGGLRECFEQRLDRTVWRRGHCDRVLELLQLGFGRQFAAQQQEADLEVRGFASEVLDGVAAVHERRGGAVNEGDAGLARRRRGEAGIM